jgi:hypothetical protein
MVLNLSEMISIATLMTKVNTWVSESRGVD